MTAVKDVKCFPRSRVGLGVEQGCWPRPGRLGSQGFIRRVVHGGQLFSGFLNSQMKNWPAWKRGGRVALSLSLESDLSFFPTRLSFSLCSPAPGIHSWKTRFLPAETGGLEGGAPSPRSRRLSPEQAPPLCSHGAWEAQKAGNKHRGKELLKWDTCI